MVRGFIGKIVGICWFIWAFFFEIPKSWGYPIYHPLMDFPWNKPSIQLLGYPALAPPLGIRRKQRKFRHGSAGWMVFGIFWQKSGLKEATWKVEPMIQVEKYVHLNSASCVGFGHQASITLMFIAGYERFASSLWCRRDWGSSSGQFFEVFKQQTKLAMNDYGEMQCRMRVWEKLAQEKYIMNAES